MGDEEEAALEDDEVDEPDEVDDEGMLESAGADGILLAVVLPLTCILFYYTNFFKKIVSCLFPNLSSIQYVLSNCYN